jgi:SAM-dependent methyltransferase
MDKLFFGWHVAAVLLAPSPSSVASDSPFESEGEALKGLDLSSWVLPPPACETAVAEIVTHVQWVWAAKPLPSARHWAPSAFVVEAADRIEAANGGIRGGVAMDIGCGSGRDAAYLASRGWTIIGIDNRMPFLGKALQLGRTVAPTPSAPLEREAAAAISLACTSSTTPATSAVTSTGAVDGLCCDATRPLPLRPGQLDLIVCVRFLVRPLLPLLAHLLAPGGWLCYSHFVDGVQHSAVGTPASPAHYVMHGELRGKCVPPAGSGIEVDVVVDREDLLADGRPVSNVLLRRRLA